MLFLTVIAIFVHGEIERRGLIPDLYPTIRSFGFAVWGVWIVAHVGLIAYACFENWVAARRRRSTRSPS